MRLACRAFTSISSSRFNTVSKSRGISPKMAVRLFQVFGGDEKSRLLRQAQYDLAQVHRERIKLKRLQLA
jgi:plasmid maintenance system antidote protein VapI